MHLGPPKMANICLKMSKYLSISLKGTSQSGSGGSAGRSKRVPCLEHGGASALCLKTHG